MSVIKDLITLGAVIIPPLLKTKKEAREIYLSRIRRAQDRLLLKRLEIEDSLRKNSDIK